MTDASPVAVLYLGGSGRSGSTVLAQELGRADGTASVGELRYIWERGLAENHLCGCGTEFRACPFWSEVLERACGHDPLQRLDAIRREVAIDRIRYIPLFAAPALRTSSFRVRHLAYIALIKPLYQAIREVSGARLIIDASKDPSYAFALSSVPGLDLRVLHLVRDSRAVAYSWSQRKVRPEIHWATEYMNILSPRTSAVHWLENNLLFEVFGRTHRKTARLRYEDFASKPDAINIARALIRDTSDPDKLSAEPFSHSISGNPIRFDEAPRPIRVDNRWMHNMDADARRVVTTLTAPLLSLYHYPLRAQRR